MNIDRQVYTVGNDRELVDGDGVSLGTDTNRLKVEAQQLELYSTFSQILKELKKINLQLSFQTDVIVNEIDI